MFCCDNIVPPFRPPTEIVTAPAFGEDCHINENDNPFTNTAGVWEGYMVKVLPENSDAE